MPKLVLKFGDRILREYPVESEVTIGRLPDNTIVIDNPAVSSHHARVFLDGDQVVVEDLRSKNGTYVNDQHVLRGTLTRGDVLLIGKHRIDYDATDEVADISLEGATPSLMGPTAYLDTRQHRAMLARLREARAARDRVAAPTKTVREDEAAPHRIRVSPVLAGPLNPAECPADVQSSISGKSEGAFVRLRGWLTLVWPRRSSTDTATS